LLDTLNGAGSQTAQVLLGNFSFPAGSSAIEVYTSNPNGQLDTTNFNDTLNIAVISAAAPTSIALTNATLNSIDINAVGGAGTVEYEVGLLGFAPGTGTAGSSPTANFTISGLSQGTTYDVYVRSNCGAGDVSAYVGPQTFNTSYGIPYVQDFENWTPGILNNPLPEGWSKAGVGPRWEAEDASGANENSGNTGPFYDNTTPNTVGGMYLYLETSTGAGSDTLVSPPIFVDTNLSTIEFGFSYHMFGATMGTLEVYADTNGVRNLLTSFVGQQQANQPDGFIRYSTFLNGYQGKSVQLVFMGLRGGSFTSDMSIDDITIDPVLPLNAGVVEVQSPGGNLCPGPVNVAIGVKNFGSLVLDSVNVLWNVNGVLDSVMYVGSIFPGDTASVSLGVLNISSTVVYDVDFYTNRPNNAADQFSADDTLKIQGLRTGLSGVLTLDASLPISSSNLTSFSELGQVLSNYGICGPTTVNVAAGTYIDVLAMDNVLGLSSINTLTIDGGDSATTFIENDLANDNAVISLKSTSYVTVKNLTVRSTNTSFNVHFGVHLGGASNFDSLVNVRVIVNPGATFNTYGVGATVNTTTNFGNGDHANNFVMMNSSVDGGDYGVNFRGNGGNFPGAGSTNGWNMNNQFIGNTLTNGNNYGFYFDDQDGIVVSGNTVSDLRTTSTFNGYGIYMLDGMNFNITSNNLVVPYTGIYVSNANSSSNGTRIGSSEISNNMVSSINNSAVWLQRPVNVDVWNNSIYCASVDANDAALYFDDGFGTPAIDSLDVRNNAISSLGISVKIDEPDSVFRKFDNNSYFSAGGNLLDIDGVIYTDLVSYTLAQPAFNASSLNGDPQFISTTDLHVIGAFINDGGDNSVPILVDIDGDARPIAGATTMDIGADEFNPPLCPPPTGAGSTNATLNSVDIFWTGTSNDYQYEVVLSGAAQGSGTTVRTTLDSVTVTGLVASTSYAYYLREICGRGDTSIWIGPLTFGTSNGVPFVENFDAFVVPTTANPWPRGWSSTTTNNPRWESETGTGLNVNSFAT
jgi:parallel beta-helix repeat protein